VGKFLTLSNGAIQSLGFIPLWMAKVLGNPCEKQGFWSQCWGREDFNIVKRGHPKPRVYPPMDGQKCEELFRKKQGSQCSGGQISNIVKRGIQSLRFTPLKDGQNVRKSLRKARVVEPMLGREKF